MKLVILSNDYPKEGSVGGMFVHTRCKHYLQCDNVELIIVNINTKQNYQYEGLDVITIDTFNEKHKDDKLDILVVHSPMFSLTKQFLESHKNLFKKIVFVFHGFESIKCYKSFPKPYSYNRPSLVLKLRQIAGEYRKIHGLRKICRLVQDKLHYVFVSGWMEKEFAKWTKIKPDKNRAHVINNCIGNEFETKVFNKNKKKEYDFLAIRSSFDGSKYCVDIVVDLAKKYSQYRFCLVGKGDYFLYNKKVDNLDIVYGVLSHSEVLDYCDNAKCALMPTRWDTQGVMVCEMATYGMPLVTSDIEVKREIVSGFENVILVENDISKIDLEKIYNQAIKMPVPKKNEKYFMKNTSLKELELFREIIK